MCGIFGKFAASSGNISSVKDRLEQMSRRVAHRGPDGSGIWVSDDARVGLGHRRLAILDLSEAGRQPMTSASGRYVMIYNGEVYNHRELRDELSAASWRGTSDSETILAAIDRWGIEKAVERFVGMFAFAIWDTNASELTLVRDRLGIKPLYYGFTSEGLTFSSELRAIAADPAFDATIDRESLARYMRYNCVPAPYTIYSNVRKLLPGTLVSFRCPKRSAARERTYWSAQSLAHVGQSDPFTGTDAEAIDELDQLMRDSVKARMLSDVPIGAFLSGGIDSSAVTAIMQAQSATSIRTFSIGTKSDQFDEAPFARAVAEHLGTNHTETYVSADEALAVIPDLCRIFDEPFADSSQIPTHIVARIAREDVTVVLSGDGGDELFGGYNRHLWGVRLWKWMKRSPRLARKCVSRAVTMVGPTTWDRVFGRMQPVLPRAMRHRMPGYKLHKLANSLAASSPHDLYEQLVSQWSRPNEVVVLDESSKPENLVTAHAREGLSDFASEMMLYDTEQYLPDDILTKVDRATMAVGLEARVPLLDHRIAEFAWRLPLSMKLRQGTSKWILRKVLERYVPREMFERPKSGFGIPLGDWLRGPLRDWAEDLLNPSQMAQEGYLRPEPIQRAWKRHLQGASNAEYALWTVLMFQDWLHHRNAV